MKQFLFSILIIIFTSCSNEEIIVEEEIISNATDTVDVSNQGIFSMCAECHGTDGKNRAFGRSKQIAGWEATRVENALQGYLAGTYGGPMSGLMRSRVMNLSDAEIKEVSRYVETLR